MHLIDDDGKRHHVRHYLTSLRAMAKELKAKEERLACLRALAEGLGSAALGKSVSGGSRRDLAEVQQGIDDLADEYAGDLARYSSEIAEGYLLCPVNDIPRYACWLHWAEGKPWGEVARRVGYSESHCKHKLCQEGVSSIYEGMPRRWRKKIPPAI